MKRMYLFYNTTEIHVYEALALFAMNYLSPDTHKCG